MPIYSANRKSNMAHNWCGREERPSHTCLRYHPPSSLSSTFWTVAMGTGEKALQWRQDKEDSMQQLHRRLEDSFKEEDVFNGEAATQWLHRRLEDSFKEEEDVFNGSRIRKPPPNGSTEGWKTSLRQRGGGRSLQ